mmetsp:Transcript_118666/g.347614  ORF Transcript_118666/g.347614 Transcript_118666/m.347614 type:complete len:298 (+) Transcript_118666:74-967(+)
MPLSNPTSLGHSWAGQSTRPLNYVDGREHNRHGTNNSCSPLTQCVVAQLLRKHCPTPHLLDRACQNRARHHDHPWCTNASVSTGTHDGLSIARLFAELEVSALQLALERSISEAFEVQFPVCPQLVLHLGEDVCLLRLGLGDLLPLPLLLLLGLLLQRQERLDHEGNQDLEEDRHGNEVEGGHEPPTEFSEGRGPEDRIHQLVRVLVEQLREPSEEGHGHVVEIEDRPVLLIVVAALEQGITSVDDAAEAVDAERGEGEEHDALRGDRDPRGAEHAHHRVDHELEALEVLELPHHPQ